MSYSAIGTQHTLAALARPFFILAAAAALHGCGLPSTAESGAAFPADSVDAASNTPQAMAPQWEGRPTIEEDPYLDPTHPEYMAGPSVVHFPHDSLVHLESGDYAEFKQQLQRFVESNNDGQYRTHFEEHYIPETFPTDSVFELYVRMWGQWDSIGVRNRFDHWAVRYISPFEIGEVYDVALAEVDIRHHMVFEKRWTGNYRNFGRTLGQRYPGADITYRDTTWVKANGDTMLRRHITAEAERFLWAVRDHGDNGRGDKLCWMNDGWQLVPDVVAIMDSAAVMQVQDHQAEFGTLLTRPQVSGR
ncbi:MAG: hypothetical protein CBC74_000430 [Crocinitomicaceae bacterium TMED114]|nr:MAG: hypothetical protein CBC74_007220 [Crocinitomicaceae bacterium TMED114]RPG81556.1 MAG: hypothetical protein CBC74_000430 [Crocinitomicaceae bacterium TMED114]